MLRAIFRQAVADLRAHRLQSGLLLLILAVATATLTLAVTVPASADDPWQRLFDQSNGAHVWFASAAGQSVDMTPVETFDGVTETAGPVPVLWDRSLLVEETAHTVHVWAASTEPRAVAHPVVTEGRWLAGGANEVVVERSFARAAGIAVGDETDVIGPDGPVALEVVGLALDSSRGLYPEYLGAVWTPETTLTAIEPDTGRWGSSFYARIADPAAVDAVAAQVRALLPPGVSVGVQPWQEIRDSANLWEEINSIFLAVFGVFACLAAGFIVANAISGRVLAHVRDIGLLKAIGFTPGQVTLVLLVQHLALALVAGVVGLAAGLAMAPLFLRQTADILNAPVSPAFTPRLWLVLVGLLAIVALFTAWPAWRAGRISAVPAISAGFGRVRPAPSRLARLATALRLPVPVTLGVKDAFARPWRAALTVSALALTVVTVTFTLGAELTIQRIVDDPALLGDPFPMAVTRMGLTDAEMRRILETRPEIASYHARGGVTLETETGTMVFQAQVVDGDYAAAGYRIAEGRMFAAPGEAVFTYGLLQELGVEVGDEVMMRLDGRPVTLQVTGRYLESEHDGVTAMLGLDTVAAAGVAVEPESYPIKVVPGTDLAALEAALLTAAGGQLSVWTLPSGPPPEATAILRLMRGLSTVLLLIGLANLLMTALLGVQERVRELGIFKALGLTPGQVVTSVIAGIALLALLGAAIGIPLGLGISLVLYTGLIQSSYGLDPLLFTTPPPWWIIVVVPAAVLVAAIASAVPAHRAAQLRITDALRYE